MSKSALEEEDRIGGCGEDLHEQKSRTNWGLGLLRFPRFLRAGMLVTYLRHTGIKCYERDSGTSSDDVHVIVIGTVYLCAQCLC